MRRVAIQVAAALLESIGYAPQLAEATASTFVELHERQRLQAWIEQACPKCIHTPGNCPFLPVQDVLLLGFHRSQIAYEAEVTCDAFTSA